MIGTIRKILYSNVFIAGIKFLILYTIILVGTVEDVGIYSYALAIVSPLFLFSSLKIKTIVVTEGARFKNIEYLTSLIIFSVLTVIIAALIIFITENNITIILITLLLAFQKLFENIKYFYHGVFTRGGHLEKVAKAQNWSYFLSFLFFLIGFLISKDLVLSISLYVLIFILTLFIEISINNNIERINFKKIEINKLILIFTTSLPLSFSSFIGSLTTQFPKYIIRIYDDVFLLGIFSSISYFLVVVTLIATSISQVFLPKLKKLSSTNINEFKKNVTKLCAIGFTIGISFTTITLLFGEKIIYLVFGNTYAEYSNVLLILSISVTFQLTAVFIGTSLTALKIYKMHSIIYTIGFLIVIITSLILIPEYSIYGAAFSLLLGNFIIFIIFLFIYIFYIRRSL